MDFTIRQLKNAFILLFYHFCVYDLNSNVSNWYLFGLGTKTMTTFGLVAHITPFTVFMHVNSLKLLKFNSVLTLDTHWM